MPRPCLPAAVAAAIALTLCGTAAAQEEVANPQTGQINLGYDPAKPSSAPKRSIPTPEEARKALMAKPDQAPSPGPTPGASAGQNPGPIGAIAETMPEALSPRNDILDRVPTEAWPLALTDAQRQRIYQAVMADAAAGAPDAAKLGPASSLSPHQVLDEMHPLPQSLADIEAVKSLHYLKTDNKVLLANPASEVVVAEITQ
jgi:hypothetical protein